MNLELENIIETVRDEYGLPSIAATAFVGRDVWSAAVGVRKVGANEPVTVNDNYHLGSVGKSFTATVAAKLVEDGAVGWDSRLEEHFSDIEMRDEYQTCHARDAALAPRWHGARCDRIEPVRPGCRT